MLVELDRDDRRRADGKPSAYRPAATGALAADLLSLATIPVV